jgi:hypothetical protein
MPARGGTRSRVPPLACCRVARYGRVRRAAHPCGSTISREPLIGHANGERHIRNARLVALEAAISDLRTRIGTVVVFDWIPAEANGAAHALVAGVLDTGAGDGS